MATVKIPRPLVGGGAIAMEFETLFDKSAVPKGVCTL